MINTRDRQNYLPLLTLLFCLLISSCSKQRDVPTQSTLTFYNQLPERIIIDRYNSKSDYDNNINGQAQYTVEPNQSVAMVLDVSSYYWFDWYSSGYGYNNWLNGWEPFSYPPPLYQATPFDESRVIGGFHRDTLRSVLLNGGNTESVWRGDLQNADSLSGIYEFRFRKDLSGECSFTDQNNMRRIIPFNYRCNGINFENDYTGRFTLYVRDLQGNGIFVMSCRLWQSYSTGRDSLAISWAGGKSKEFLVSRQ